MGGEKDAFKVCFPHDGEWRLAIGTLVEFHTPFSQALSDLFHDEVDGPPTILVQPASADGSHLVTGAGDTQFFQLGIGGLADLPGYLAPLNLYVDDDSKVTVRVRMDQALSPFESNINSDRIRLEWRDLACVWHAITTQAKLLQNCGGGGSTVELSSDGVLPQSRILRVWVSPELEDIVGDQNLMPLTMLQFETDFSADTSGQPGDELDERYVGFESGENSLEDTEFVSIYPLAEWDGRLLSVNTIVGPGGANVNSQVAINGVLVVRDLYVPAGSVLHFVGPKPVTIHGTGDGAN